METTICPYAVTQRYINDRAHLFSKEELKLLLGLVRAREYKVLAQVTSDNRLDLSSAERWKTLSQVEAFFKKNVHFTDETAANAAAVASFERGERICRITNRRLDYYHSKRDRLDPDLRRLISRSERFIEKALGDFEDFFEQVPNLLKVTSGATASLARKHALPPLKFERTVECCPGTVPYLNAIANKFGLAFKIKPEPCNRVEFVPKNWKTERGIACEPTGSLPFQLAFDTFAKVRLRKFGVNLSDQSGNQEHAYRGSIDGSLATIDLSMASDTLAFNAVAWLLPYRFFAYLRDHRSPQYRLNGSIGEYAKFSSMGNGATFALESLIFLSFVRAAGCSDGLVYGDDITIKTEHVPALLKLLRFFGFIPNEDKSFSTGPFRESCGEHYFNGVEVTPFYVRDIAGWNIPNLCHNVNGLVHAGEYPGELWTYLKATCEGLLKVPVNDNTLTGVHVTPQTAYALKLIKSPSETRRIKKGYYHQPIFKGYVAKSTTRRIDDSRASLLWHLRSYCKSESFRRKNPTWREPPGAEATVTSRYSMSSEKFGRSWQSWNISGRAPAYLYDWSDFLIRES